MGKNHLDSSPAPILLTISGIPFTSAFIELNKTDTSYLSMITRAAFRKEGPCTWTK
jgi:hypothetical protein